MKNFFTTTLVLLMGLGLTACNLPGADTEDDSEATVEVNYDNQDYVGMSVPNAQAKATAANVPFRLVEIDGEPQAVTADYRPGRINAKVEKGVITEYTVEGAE